MQPNNRNQVITSRVTLEQKNVYILNAEKSGLSLSEWIAETLDKHENLLAASTIFLQDELEVKNKLVNRLTNDLENADEYIKILERRNFNHRNRIARLNYTIEKLKASQPIDVKVNPVSNLNNKNNPFFIFGSITALIGAIVFATK